MAGGAGRRSAAGHAANAGTNTSSGLYRFLAIAVLLDVKDIPQVGPLQWGWINDGTSLCLNFRALAALSLGRPIFHPTLKNLNG